MEPFPGVRGYIVTSAKPLQITGPCLLCDLAISIPRLVIRPNDSKLVRHQLLAFLVAHFSPAPMVIAP